MLFSNVKQCLLVSKRTIHIPCYITGITIHYINFAVTTESRVLMDGQLVSLTWNTFYGNENNIIEYGTQIQITDLTSRIISTEFNTKFNTLM